MTSLKYVLVAVLGLSISGCAGSEYGTKETVGTLLGGVGGAVAGAQFGRGTGQVAAGAAGALLGAFLGNQAGKSLDRADQQFAYRAEQDALEHTPSGNEVTWSNPDSGNYGSIKPVQTYQSSEGRYCREYTHTVVIGGEPQDAYGRACRQPDGSWEVQS
jgi:surface antigen